MPILPKAFFGYLILVMLVSFVGSWISLTKIHQQNWWPNREQMGYHDYQGRSNFDTLTVKTVHVFDTIIGKIFSLTLIVGMIYVCGKLAFQYGWLYTGLLTLQVFAAYCAWIAIYLRFFNHLVFFIRM